MRCRLPVARVVHDGMKSAGPGADRRPASLPDFDRPLAHTPHTPHIPHERHTSRSVEYGRPNLHTPHTPHIPHERHTSRSVEYGRRPAAIGASGRAANGLRQAEVAARALAEPRANRSDRRRHARPLQQATVESRHHRCLLALPGRPGASGEEAPQPVQSSQACRRATWPVAPDGPILAARASAASASRSIVSGSQSTRAAPPSSLTAGKKGIQLISHPIITR